MKVALISILTYFFEDLLGFNPGVFPGVFLLSRLRLSGLPVESAIGFGPSLSAITVILVIYEGIPSCTVFKIQTNLLLKNQKLNSPYLNLNYLKVQGVC